MDDRLVTKKELALDDKPQNCTREHAFESELLPAENIENYLVSHRAGSRGALPVVANLDKIGDHGQRIGTPSVSDPAVDTMIERLRRYRRTQRG